MEDIKFLPRSIIRLQLLKSLYNEPQDMKQLNNETKLNYSAISTNMHLLESKGYIYKQDNKYFLSNSMRIFMNNCIDLGKLFNVLDEFFYIFNQHIIKSIPIESILDIHNLENAFLIENDEFNPYKIYNFIENSIKKAKFLNGIIPFYYKDLDIYLNNLAKKNRKINLLVPFNIRQVFTPSVDNKNNFHLKYYNGGTSYPFLLIYTDKSIIFGLFKEDGVFDQNRILTSNNASCINWGKNLFDNFKKEVI